MASPWLRLRPLVRAHRAALLRAFGWLLLLAASTGAYGLLAGPVLRALFGGDTENPGGLYQAMNLARHRDAIPYWVVAVALVKGIAARQHAVSQAQWGQRVVGTLRVQTHAALLERPSGVVAAWGAGDVLSRLTDDVDRVEALVTQGLVGAARDVLQVLVLLGVCVALDPAMALLFFGAYPLAIVPMATFGRRLRRAAGTAAAERGALSVELHQQLHRLPLLQAHGATAWARRRFEHSTSALSRAVLRGVGLRAVASPLMEVLGAVALSVTVVYARDRIDAGTLSAEQVLSFLASALLLYAPVKGLTRFPEVAAPGWAALDRLTDLTCDPPGVRIAAFRPGGGGPSAAPRIECRGLIVPRAEGRGLQLPAAVFAPGRVTAVCGPNGSGKSTLALTLLGQLAPSAGDLLIDGQPLASLDRDTWRRCLGWVPQAPLLARGTLRENVGLGDPVLGGEDYERVAREAGLEVLLGRLPAGWETPLDDAGEGLSGGEQRRIALARALIRRPLVLLLDEPEVSLDAAALTDLAANLPALATGRTVILLTHEARLAAVADARLDLVAHSAPLAPLAPPAVDQQ
jgi:ABC-type multidrug transport system fused ATPase/permease subunit